MGISGVGNKVQKKKRFPTVRSNWTFIGKTRMFLLNDKHQINIV